MHFFLKIFLCLFLQVFRAEGKNIEISQSVKFRRLLFSPPLCAILSYMIYIYLKKKIFEKKKKVRTYEISQVANFRNLLQFRSPILFSS